MGFSPMDQKMLGIRCICLLLCTSGVHTQSLFTVTYSPQNICVLTGSSVLLTCRFTPPPPYKFSFGKWWKTDDHKQDYLQEYNSRIEYKHNNPVFSLRISNLIRSDSGVYNYRIHSYEISKTVKDTRGVTLTVTDVPRKDCWGVSYSSTSFCVLRGSTVHIPCSYGYPSDHKVTTFFWYRDVKKGEDPTDLRVERDYEDRVEYLSTEEHKSALRIRDVRETESGEYRFRYTTDKPGGAFSSGIVTISVTDLQVLTSAGRVTQGGNVTLTCITSCSLGNGTTFIWYKNTQATRHGATNNILHLNPVSSEDAGNYSCAVRGHEEYRSPEAALDVRYAPQNTTVIVTPSGNLHEGDSVILTCSSDANPSVHNYTWHRKIGNETVLIGSSPNLTIINVNLSTGLYYCVAHNSVGEDNSAVVSLSVAGLTQGFAKEMTIGILIVVALLLVLGLLWLRRQKNTCLKKESTTNLPQADSSPVYNVAALTVTSNTPWKRAAEAGDDVQYASVQFKNSKGPQLDPYIIVQHPHTPKVQEDVQYASIIFTKRN